MAQSGLPETWAQLLLSSRDSRRIRTFLIGTFGVKADRVVGTMHLTVYYARRLMPGVRSSSVRAHVVLPAAETRFMVMAPGGENPRPEFEPAQRKVGIRVQRKSAAMSAILDYRARLIADEHEQVRGGRRPSNHRRNAFGARHFQPHMSLIKPGSGIDRDLTLIGNAFREQFAELLFDRFIIDVVASRAGGAQPDRRVKAVAPRFGNSIRWKLG